MTEVETPRRNRRDTARRTSSASSISQTAPGVASRMFPPTRLISDDQVESMHNASLRVLSEIGMDFMLPEARELLSKSGGCTIEGERVRFEPAFIEETMKSAPAQFTLHARNPAHDMKVGGPNIAFGTVGSPPSCHDLDHGRRTGTREDYQKFIKLGQHFNCIDFMGGFPVEPIDLHASVRHLEAFRDMVTLTDKPFVIYSLGRQRVLDDIEITRRAYGLSEEEFSKRPYLGTIVNTNSPLKLDGNMLMGMMELSRRAIRQSA